jgi:hypothetical protein
MRDAGNHATSSWDQPPEAVAIELTRTFPSYTVRVRWDPGRQPRFEARARDDRYPTCLISPDADEIRAELNGA